MSRNISKQNPPLTDSWASYCSTRDLSGCDVESTEQMLKNGYEGKGVCEIITIIDSGNGGQYPIIPRSQNYVHRFSAPPMGIRINKI